MKESNIENLVERSLNGDVAATSRLITLAESTDKNEEIIKLISPHLGNAYVVGITGAPGVGKSTLTEKLVRSLIKDDKKVGIIAVDPTSPFSGGALLGDRIRLQKLSTEDNVFIRSMATRGHLGGISPTTSEVKKILDAFGCDYIFIETVGVGQSEVEIVKNVDTTLLILIPGMGDEIQAIKAGIMEIADIFVVNKADKDGVERTVLEIEMLCNLSEESIRNVPIKQVIARDNEGIEELITEIREHKNFLIENKLFHKYRKKRLEVELKQIAHKKLLEHTHKAVSENYDLHEILDAVYKNKTDVYTVVDKLLKKIVKK